MSLKGSITEAGGDWKIHSSGFLETKNMIGGWRYKWVVLDNHKLFIYQDETERQRLNKILITSTTIVEAVQPEHSRLYLFNIFDPMNQESTSPVVLSAPDFSSLEEWMLAIIQCVNGSYRESENFCSGYPSVSERRSSLILPTAGGLSERYSRSTEQEYDPERSGYLLKQGSEFKTWKRRWFQLKHSHLRYFEHEAEGLKGFRFLDNESRVVLLPSGLDGQQYGFSLITMDPMTGQAFSLRLSAHTEDEMFQWVASLRCAIRRYSEDQYSIPIEEQDDERRVTCDSEEDDDDKEESPLLARRKRAPSQMSVAYIDSPLIRVSPEESLTSLLSETNTPKQFYLNDNTVWAKINQKISPSIHHAGNQDLQRLYLLHFCALIPGTNFILVEVFEHQRYLPLKGWNCLHLGFSDCSKLANCIGVKYPDRYLRRADPPLDYEWVQPPDNSSTSINRETFAEGINLHEYGIFTPWKWTVCRAFTVEGEKAWCYGTNFEDIRKKYEDPELRMQAHLTRGPHDVVRRRRWIRLAVEINP
jgi:hypothetical protein